MAKINMMKHNSISTLKILARDPSRATTSSYNLGNLERLFKGLNSLKVLIIETFIMDGKYERIEPSTTAVSNQFQYTFK
jgi:hypothetical protein